MIVAIDTNCILPGKVGGIENYTMSLVESLLAHALADGQISRMVLICRKENVDLFSKFDGDRCRVAVVPRPRVDGTEVHNWGELERSNAKLCRRLLTEFAATKRKLIADHQIDVVHFPGNAMNPLEIGVASVLTLHDLQHVHYPGYFTAHELQNREKWWHESARRASVVIAGTRHGASDLQRQLGLSDEKLEVVPYTTQAEYLRPVSDTEVDSVRQSLNIRMRYFLYPAAGWAHKNHAFLFRAFERSELMDMQLVCVGHGLDSPAIRGARDSCSERERIQLLARASVPQLRALYRGATALVFPSLYEGWGIPVTEAMCCRCPVLAADVTALPEVVADAGVLFDPHDVDGLSRLMRSAAHSDCLRNHLRDRGLTRVYALSPGHFSERLLSVYCRAIQMHRARRLRRAS